MQRASPRPEGADFVFDRMPLGIALCEAESVWGIMYAVFIVGPTSRHRA
jgi:hypothetical protein